jgi:hypothetical protein
MLIHLKKHAFAYAILGFLALGFAILNAHMALPFPGVLYWDYARHFSLGYIDSPFGLPLFIKSYSFIFGYGPAAFGYINFLLFLLTSLFMYLGANALYDTKAARLVLIMSMALPVISKFFEHLDYHLLAIATFTASTLLISAAVKTGKKAYMLLAGISLGWMLVSQFECVILAGTLFIAMLCIKEYRALWRWPVTYVALGVSVLFVLPFVLWQWQHHFITLTFLKSSNAGGLGFDIPGFFSAVNDYIGSIALFFILFLVALFRFPKEAVVRFFFLLFILLALALNFMFMHNPILHTTLISANIVLFFFLAGSVYKNFPRFTWGMTIVSLLVTVIFVPLNLILQYHTFNYLSFGKLLTPLIQSNTVIISNVVPYDNAPSYFSIELPGQPDVFALQEVPVNYNHKGNAAVYFWQPSLTDLQKTRQADPIVFLNNAATLPVTVQKVATCKAPIRLQSSFEKVNNISDFLHQGFQQGSSVIYAFECKFI